MCAPHISSLVWFVYTFKIAKTPTCPQRAHFDRLIKNGVVQRLRAAVLLWKAFRMLQVTDDFPPLDLPPPLPLPVGLGCLSKPFPSRSL